MLHHPPYYPRCNRHRRRDNATTKDLSRGERREQRSTGKLSRSRGRYNSRWMQSSVRSSATRSVSKYANTALAPIRAGANKDDSSMTRGETCPAMNISAESR